MEKVKLERLTKRGLVAGVGVAEDTSDGEEEDINDGAGVRVEVLVLGGEALRGHRRRWVQSIQVWTKCERVSYPKLKLEKSRLYRANYKVLIDYHKFHNMANISKLWEILLDGSYDQVEKMLNECKAEGEKLDRQYANNFRLLACLENFFLTSMDCPKVVSKIHDVIWVVALECLNVENVD
ncbi:hypothetical protein L7F22_050529 [Adiantum nelumboides]|nr:hypothetical protein [Adiantum nelumboides]